MLMFLVFLLFGWSTLADAQKSVSFERTEIFIETKSGQHRFAVEFAHTPEQLSFGLMFRRALPRDAGMLFNYARPQKVAMWMKNTLIPLDMLFIDTSGRIVHIRQRAVPGSLEAISSKVPVRGVLELNGGTVSRLGITLGDKVRHKIFGN
tara:strand:+ start:648 stop:1097 length:450 start_codon:yes stop_codon:yes gene_type:complete